jgi:hypothetical protein
VELVPVTVGGKAPDTVQSFFFHLIHLLCSERYCSGYEEDNQGFDSAGPEIPGKSITESGCAADFRVVN